MAPGGPVACARQEKRATCKAEPKYLCGNLDSFFESDLISERTKIPPWTS